MPNLPLNFNYRLTERAKRWITKKFPRTDDIKKHIEGLPGCGGGAASKVKNGKFVTREIAEAFVAYLKQNCETPHELSEQINDSVGDPLGGLFEYKKTYQADEQNESNDPAMQKHSDLHPVSYTHLTLPTKRIV